MTAATDRTPRPLRLRAGALAAAFVATFSILAGVQGLATHDSEALQLAQQRQAGQTQVVVIEARRHAHS